MELFNKIGRKLYVAFGYDKYDKEKINNLRVHMIDLPGMIRPLLKDLPNFCKKYNLTYAEYKLFVEACHNNNFWIESKDLNTM